MNQIETPRQGSDEVMSFQNWLMDHPAHDICGRDGRVIGQHTLLDNLPPGVRLQILKEDVPAHYHAETVECIYVLDGCMVVNVQHPEDSSPSRQELGERSMLTFEPGMRHAYFLIDGPCTILSFKPNDVKGDTIFV